MPRERITLDATDALLVLNEIHGTLQAVHEHRLQVDVDLGTGRRSDPDAAKLSRDLLRAGAMARVLAGEIESIYWQFKGYPDPRDVPES